MAAPPKKAFPLRLDPALYAAIERSAATDLRSVNAQVECLLREALAKRGVKLADPIRAKRGRPPKED
ncbi:MAG: toxin-antitoxin system HicB family antitoxin [Sphingomonadales bacterium]|nr:MAG: toxin-antitoxin system HicB family antitoxin [Sphingomonadales bacterium]